jgi:hypothetical protein
MISQRIETDNEWLTNTQTNKHEALFISSQASRRSATQQKEFPVLYQGADKSLARPTSRCILFDGENISFDASLVIYIHSTNIPPIVIINREYEH